MPAEILEAIVWAGALLIGLIIVAATSSIMWSQYLGRRGRPFGFAKKFTSEFTNVSTMIAAAHFASAVVAMRYEKNQGKYEFDAIDALVRQFIKSITDPDETKRLTDLKILWAHKEPKHDEFEKRVFDTLGANVDFCLTTKAAVDKFNATYDLVISNMKRPFREGSPDDEDAAFKLLAQLQEMKSTVPYIIYSRTCNEKQDALAQQRGVALCTGDPNELFAHIFQNHDIKSHQNISNRQKTAEVAHVGATSA